MLPLDHPQTVCRPFVLTPVRTHGAPACRLWKGLTPLWGRQIPYTMMKFGEHCSSQVQADALHSLSLCPTVECDLACFLSGSHLDSSHHIRTC